MQRFSLLGVLTCACAWLTWHGLAGRWWLGGLGATGLLSHYIVLLALETLLAAHLHGTDPTPRPSTRQWLQAWWAEVGWCSAVFGWRQPFREHALTDDVAHRGRRGIVFVHGYCCNRGFWTPWFRLLRAAGVPYASVSLVPIFASIDDYAPQLDAAVRRLEAATGLTPVLVCHSMGGLVARAWWRWRRQTTPPTTDAPPAHRILTIGTPHAGTWLARWAKPLNARQMRQHSPWLQALAASESAPQRARFVCVYSHCDNIVFPPSTAALNGAHSLHLDGLAHLQLAHDARVQALALQLLDSTDLNDTITL
jgi:hypothetical protein